MNKSESLALLKQGASIWNTWARAMLSERESLQSNNHWANSGPGSIEAQNWKARAEVDFAGHSFEESIDFSSFIFPGDVRFDRAAFSGGATFHKTEFFGNASFNDIDFFAQPTFWDSAFFGITHFIRSEFSDRSSFIRSRFLDIVDFSEACFFDDAEFDDVTFSNYVTFNKVTFWGLAGFRNARFLCDVEFQMANFRGPAGFQGAHFEANGTFQGSRFLSGAWFQKISIPHFSHEAFRDTSFRSATFDGSSGLTQAHIDLAKGSHSITLPSGLSRPAHWAGEEASPPLPTPVPPAIFEWARDSESPKLVLRPPGRSTGGAGGGGYSIARNRQLQTVANLAQDILTMFEKGNQSDGARIFRDLLEPLKSIAREAAKPGHRVNAGYLRAKLRILETILYKDKSNKFLGEAQTHLDHLIEETRRLLDHFREELRRIDYPKGERLIPEEEAAKVDDVANALLEILESAEGRELLSDDVVDYVRVERDCAPEVTESLVASPEDMIAHQRRKLSRFGGLIESLNEALSNPPGPVKLISRFVTFASRVDDLWKRIKHLFEQLP